MKLTNATEQALAIMAMLATQTKDIPASSRAIYEKLTVSPSYVKKLLRKLVVSKIISGVSGANGGFYIERNLEEISLLEIVESIEGPFRSFPHVGVLEQAFSDFTDIAESSENVIESFFSQADKAWDAALQDITVKDILDRVFIDYQTQPTRDWNIE
ncbi:RrF2 family transcriptional regulator [Vagococcus vulneris]|uniref:Transcriptional regulator n=1 Tax=Vagococcus vulneris TaxID=1977869 RepID=A0A429ZWG5_9ENTE|nr:Rrf2 family transcriptional regulator [Vagococcus vulneris]RST98138.1 hypothetical protein CBF37_08890 [Vagococcus vulneris]